MNSSAFSDFLTYAMMICLVMILATVFLAGVSVFVSMGIELIDELRRFFRGPR